MLEIERGPARESPTLAVVVPCFNEESCFAEAATRLLEALRDLVEKHLISPTSFLYFVDDGSRDRTWALITELHEQNSTVKGLRLARNFGNQTAVLAGLLSVRERCDCVVSIDCDLQHDAREIEKFVARFREGADIVYGVRNDRASDSLMKRASALFFYRLMNLMGVQIVKNHSDFRLISRKVLDALSEYGEYNLFLRGIFVDIGFRPVTVPVRINHRFAGRSKYSPARLISLALDAVTSFSVAPLRVVTIAGVLIFMWSCLMTVYVIFAFMTGRAVPGWASTLVPIYFLGGTQIIMMGLVGEYIGKIYKEVKARPRYIKDAELF